MAPDAGARGGWIYAANGPWGLDPRGTWALQLTTNPNPKI